MQLPTVAGALPKGTRRPRRGLCGLRPRHRHQPQLCAAYCGRGTAKGNKGDYDGAIADFDRAIAINPNYAEAYYNRGLVKAEQGDYDGAIADYDRAIAINPNYAVAYCGRGVAKAEQGDYDGAIADFDRAIAINPNCGGLRQPGRHQTRKGDYDGAMLTSPSTPAMHGLPPGLVKAEQGDYDGAIADFDRAIAINPNYVLAYYNRGSCSKDKEQGAITTAQVMADYDRAIAINPN